MNEPQLDDVETLEVGQRVGHHTSKDNAYLLRTGVILEIEVLGGQMTALLKMDDCEWEESYLVENLFKIGEQV